jgi:hypothetical protein
MKDVRVYWNTRNRLFSIQQMRGGRWIVVARAETFVLDNVEFDVSIAGRDRCRREGQKNVHAYMCAEWITLPGEPGFSDTEDSGDVFERMTYNPYRDDGFTVGGDVITYANVVRCTTIEGRPLVLVTGAYPIHPAIAAA